MSYSLLIDVLKGYRLSLTGAIYQLISSTIWEYYKVNILIQFSTALITKNKVYPLFNTTICSGFKMFQ